MTAEIKPTLLRTTDLTMRFGGLTAMIQMEKKRVDSLLIVDTNTTVYFASSNGWTSANFVLIGDAELHQIIPEPSTVLLLLSGAGVMWRARRRANRF